MMTMTTKAISVLMAVWAGCVLAETPATPAPATPAADSPALAALQQEEKALITQTMELRGKIADNQRPLTVARQRAMADDKDIQALSKDIAAKQRELEAMLMAKYPDVAARSKAADEMNRKHADLMQKLRDVRRKLDEARAAVQVQPSEKQAGI